ncbi:MAG: hypothetical protein RTU92_10935 [Candidatus Thorarchaeota archaeon]
MNAQTRAVRSKLLRRYYRTAALGWFHPRSLHWAKIVTQDGQWRWIRSHSGIRGRLLRNPPIHLYQTVLRIKSNHPPRGSKTSGHMMGGPLLFDMDMIGKGQPFSIWKIIDAAGNIEALVETISDRGNFKVGRIIFSGYRGVHVTFEEKFDADDVIQLGRKQNDWKLRALKRKRKQTARAIGYWCPGWDWKVTTDIWRVSRVPWSIHGKSSLRAIVLKPPFTSRNIREQMKLASVFSDSRKLSIRTKRATPSFGFVDGETYGPFRQGWAVNLPLTVAIHLIWLGFAKPREIGPMSTGLWFNMSWQTLFRVGDVEGDMGKHPQGGVGS